MKLKLPFWQRLILTILVMLVASYVVGFAWQKAMGVPLPSYVAGIVGGLAALPIWEFLQRIRPSQES